MRRHEPQFHLNLIMRCSGRSGQAEICVRAAKKTAPELPPERSIRRRALELAVRCERAYHPRVPGVRQVLGVQGGGGGGGGGISLTLGVIGA
jgi:hypothetical protein